MASKCITSYNGSEKNGNVMVNLCNFLLDKGFTVNQTCGIMGSIAFKSAGYQVGVVNGNGAIGLCQWLYGRKTKLKERAQKNGKQWQNMQLQLDFMWEELNSTEGKTLSWFKSHPDASIAESAKQWTLKFERPEVKGRQYAKRTKLGEEAYEFYKKYASGECSNSKFLDTSSNENQSNEDGEGEAGSNIGTGSNIGIEVDDSKMSVECGVNVNVINSTPSGNADENNGGDGNEISSEENVTTNNTTDYKGKTLKLRLEREDFNCKRTIGRLYDTTDGKKEFICYTVEDRVRYNGNNCVFKSYDTSDPAKMGILGTTAIPYGTYSFSMAGSGAAKKCGGKIERSCRYFYAANYKKYPKYNGKIALLSNKKCGTHTFTQVLIHATTDNNKADENNTAGCIVVGMKKNGSYLSGSIDAFYHLYENYILPAKESGSKLEIDIPRLYSSKDQGCYNS